MRPGTPQVWRPLGRIIAPEPKGDWWASHASYPTALSLSDETVRVFFSIRAGDNRSALAVVDLALEGERWTTLGPVRGPLLTPGPRGAFDADGVTVSSVVEHEGRLLAYYLGWTVGRGVPFTNFIGLAVADPVDLRFERWSPAPVVGRSRENPFTVGYPWVLREGNGFRMWFGTHLQWGATGLDMVHVLKQARSGDGLTWGSDDRVVLPLAGHADAPEFALSRPAVIGEPGGGYSMWYARRRPNYELGYARSSDGETWSRADGAISFAGRPQAWEDAERTYPCVFDHGGRRYMLYNGNGYGRTGFGLALLEGVRSFSSNDIV